MIEASALQKHSLFGGLQKDDVDMVLSLMKTKDYIAGEEIIHEGTPNDRVSFILDGRVSVEKNGTVLAELKEGDTFGEMEVIDIMPSAADIKAVIPTKVISISNRDLHQIYKNDLKLFSMLVMNLARDLSRRIRSMNEKAAKQTIIF